MGNVHEIAQGEGGEQGDPLDASLVQPWATSVP